MLRVWVVAITIALFPLIAQAEEQTVEQHAELQTGKEKQVLIAISTGKQSGEVRISILNVKKENNDERQKDEFVLFDCGEPVSDKKHSKRRGK
ncbi:MAG: hypothetical protein WC731_05900 [Candidatus Omnitrophota bacterium]|jgi:hypothetical protein